MDVAVTQGTSTSTAVTANGSSGLITCFTSVQAALTTVTFTVNNTATDADSVVLLTVTNYSGTYVTNGIPVVYVSNCVAGTSFDIKIVNAHATVALGGVLKIGFFLQ
jgi:hypothetical protein